MSFTAIPVLDLSLSQHPDTKPAFLSDLRNALLEVGFLYIRNTGVDKKLIDEVIADGKAFFDLPDDAKLAIQMKNAPSFLGPRAVPNSPQTCKLCSADAGDRQDTTNLAMKSPPTARTTANKSTSPRPTPSPAPPPPSTTTSSPQTSGPNRPSSPPSALPSKPT